jgi:hypothetical protein
MGKAIGLLLAVVAIWFTVELYTQGPDQAFGGLLASSMGSEEGAAPRATTAQRAGAAVERANAEHEARYKEMLGE